MVSQGGVAVQTILGDLASFFSRDIGEQGHHVEAHHDVSGFEGQILAELNEPGRVGDVVGCAAHQGLENVCEEESCLVSRRPPLDETMGRRGMSGL